MEFFIPGLLVFIVAIIISFVIVPRATPVIVAVLSIGFLTLGVYEHYKMFSSEYRLSTWQDGLKIYSPAIMICAILIFIIYAIFAFFTKGSVPIPKMPNIKASNNITNTVMQTVNTVVNSLKVNKNDKDENNGKSNNKANNGNNNGKKVENNEDKNGNEDDNTKSNKEEIGSTSLFETL